MARCYSIRPCSGTRKPDSSGFFLRSGDFGLEIGRNLVHGSDSPESAQRELDLFFQPGELLNVSRDIDPWVFE